MSSSGRGRLRRSRNWRRCRKWRRRSPRRRPGCTSVRRLALQRSLHCLRAGDFIHVQVIDFPIRIDKGLWVVRDVDVAGFPGLISGLKDNCQLLLSQHAEHAANKHGDHSQLTIGQPCFWKVFPALLPQKSVLKTIIWSWKCASKSHEPSKFATGSPNSLSRGFFFLSPIDGGMALRGNVHIFMPWEVHSIAKTPPPAALKADPVGRLEETVQPV